MPAELRAFTQPAYCVFIFVTCNFIFLFKDVDCVIFSLTLIISLYLMPVYVCVSVLIFPMPCRHAPVIKSTVYLLTTSVMKANWQTGHALLPHLQAVNLKAQRSFLSDAKCFGVWTALHPDSAASSSRCWHRGREEGGVATKDFAVGRCFLLRVPRNQQQQGCCKSVCWNKDVQ